jgi:hypothetical protein
MVDFSHLANLRPRPESIVWYHASGNRPTDELFLEAFEGINPPLLSKLDTDVVRSALKPRRGRPLKAAPSVDRVAHRIEMSRRSDVPKDFLDLLAVRLRTGERYTTYDVHIELRRHTDKIERTAFVWLIYDAIYSRLDGGGFVDHPILGRLEVPKNQTTRSVQALMMTHDVLHNRMGGHPPSVRTLQNIITARNRRRFRESLNA